MIDKLTAYGSYCGPYNQVKNKNPIPIDSLDECCLHHDARWGDVKKDENYLKCGEGARADLDADFVSCLQSLHDRYTNKWPNPPKDKKKALLYRKLSIGLFSPCKAN